MAEGAASLQQVLGDIGQTGDVSAGHCALELSQVGHAVDELAGGWPVSNNHLELNDEGGTTAEHNQRKQGSPVSDSYMISHSVLSCAVLRSAHLLQHSVLLNSMAAANLCCFRVDVVGLEQVCGTERYPAT